MKIRVFFLSVALVLASGSGLAQKRKAGGGDDLDLSGGKKVKAGFKPESGVDVFQEAENDQLEGFVESKQKEASRKRLKLIKKLRGILKKKRHHRGKPGLLFRIAESEWAESKYRYFLLRKRYDREYDKYLNGTLKKKPEEPVADYTKALKEYKILLKEFPNYSRIDQVIFYLGRGLVTAGKKKAGASYMNRLTKEHPRSKYVTQAYLAVAEFYFDNDLLFAAKTNYQKVLEDSRSGQYPYALYKLGYVHYNLKEYEDSIKSFKEVVSMSKGKDKRKVYFMKQAYSAMTMSFAEVPDGWKRAKDYFSEQGGKTLYTPKLESIARLYSKQDKNDEEVEVYEYLISDNKQGGKVPEYAEKITANYKKREELDKSQKTIDRFTTYFDPKGSWYVANQGKEEPMIRANQYREEQNDYLIATFHTKAQELEKLNDPEKAGVLYRKAAVYYEKFIKLFPKAKDLYEKEFFLAEIYFYETKEWDKASSHYRQVVEIDKKGKYSKESAWAIILAKQEKLIEAGLLPKPTKSRKKGKKGSLERKAKVEYTKRKTDDFKPIVKAPLDPLQNEFLEACSYYVDTYPKNDKVPEVSFLAAEIYIGKGHYEGGVKRLEVIMEYHSKHRFAGFAAATLFDANYRLKRWDQMERWGRYMLKRKNFKVMNKKKLLEVIAISINEYATELSAKGQNDKAAKQMMRFVNEFPKHDKAPIALYNAAAINEKAERNEEAIRLYERVIKAYPKAPQATESHYVLGMLYESQTNFEKAAWYFEKMASFPDVPQMADALYNAGSVRESLEQYDKAIKIFGTYVKKFPDDEQSQTLILKIAETHKKLKAYKKALKTYDSYLKKYSKVRPDMVPELLLRKAKIYQTMGGKRDIANAKTNLEKVKRSYKKLKPEIKRKPTVRHAMAQALFELAEYKYQAFENKEWPKFTKWGYREIRIFQKFVQEKAKLLSQAEKAYFDIVGEFKQWDVTAGALFRIAEGYYKFGTGFGKLPVPEGLNEDEIIEYETLIDELAFPIQEKSIEAAKRPLRLAQEKHVYNIWAQRAGQLLVKNDPDSFPILSDEVVNTDWTVPSTFSRNFVADPKDKLEQLAPPEPPKKPAPAAGAAGGPAQTDGDTKEESK